MSTNQDRMTQISELEAANQALEKNPVTQACTNNVERNREQIRQTAFEVAARYQDAKISTFIPIFIRRVTMERLGLLRIRKSSNAP